MPKVGTEAVRWTIGQLAVLASGFGVLAGWPPRSGALLLVPLGSGSAARTVPLALAGHAWLAGPGPFPDSYVVRGDRDALLPAMTAAGILILAAPPAGCGEGVRDT